VARVWIKEGSGQFVVNDNALIDYFQPIQREHALGSLLSSNMAGYFDVWCTVKGGGLSGACRVHMLPRHITSLVGNPLPPDRPSGCHPAGDCEGVGGVRPSPADRAVAGRHANTGLEAGGAKEARPKEGTEAVPVGQAVIPFSCCVWRSLA
jgi:hypothetical protein